MNNSGINVAADIIPRAQAERKIKKMKKSILILMMVGTGFFCSGQSSKSTADSVYVGTSDSIKNAKSHKPSTKRNENIFNTRYEYTESNGARLVIQNSFPKSGINYTDPNGKKYVYAVFWTQITNETFDPLELTIDFPVDSFKIPSTGIYMRLLLADSMTIDKEPLYDYGLTIKSFLDNNRHKTSSLKRTIHPKGSSAFYVVTLSNRDSLITRSNRGGDGILRTGLSLREQNLLYSVNDKEIHCGKINFRTPCLIP
jgi:hypothetical protein